MNLSDTFEQLWEQYRVANPQAGQIHQLLQDRGEAIVNDHVAFRTFNHPNVNVAKLGTIFEKLGYEAKGQYTFEAKKLNAVHYEHASGDWPLVFISELLLDDFSLNLQAVVGSLADQVDVNATEAEDFLYSGIHWMPISLCCYERLLEESEYAAWTSAFGFRANHFTVRVNDLKDFDLLSLNAFLKENGFGLNCSGGEIKGSAEQFLEQSSTLAANTDVQFFDCVKKIPCCYYEFAQRYLLANGELFSGFVTSSADKIFESTDAR